MSISKYLSSHNASAHSALDRPVATVDEGPKTMGEFSLHKSHEGELKWQAIEAIPVASGGYPSEYSVTFWHRSGAKWGEPFKLAIWEVKTYGPPTIRAFATPHNPPVQVPSGSQRRRSQDLRIRLGRRLKEEASNIIRTGTTNVVQSRIKICSSSTNKASAQPLLSSARRTLFYEQTLRKFEHKFGCSLWESEKEHLAQHLNLRVDEKGTIRDAQRTKDEGDVRDDLGPDVARKNKSATAMFGEKTESLPTGSTAGAHTKGYTAIQNEFGGIESPESVLSKRKGEIEFEYWSCIPGTPDSTSKPTTESEQPPTADDVFEEEITWLGAQWAYIVKILKERDSEIPWDDDY